MKTVRRNIMMALTLLLWFWTVQRTLAWYDPSTGRWLTRDPIGELGFRAVQGTLLLSQSGNSPQQPSRWISRENSHGDSPLDHGEQASLYKFVKNDPINWIDLFGLDPHDVNRILKAARSYIDAMTAAGERSGDGALGAVLNNLRVTPWSKRVGCAEQSSRLLGNALLPLRFDDTWTFARVRTVLPLTHQFIIAHSDNPIDPTILIDPNHNEITILHGPSTTGRVLIGAPEVYRIYSDGTVQRAEVSFGDSIQMFFGPLPASPFTKRDNQ